VEDFNTSTLPHRKFYNLEFYHREKAAKARKKGHSDEVRTINWLTQMHTCHIAVKLLQPVGRCVRYAAGSEAAVCLIDPAAALLLLTGFIWQRFEAALWSC